MRFIFKKSCIVTEKLLPFLLVLTVVFSSVISLCINTSVRAASGGPTTAGETIYLNTTNNTAWNPTSSTKTVAVFRDSAGNVLGGSYSPYNFTAVSGKTGLYSVSAPGNAAKIDVIVANKTTVIPGTLAAEGSHRVFFDNSTNKLRTPTVYCWDTGNNHNANYPGVAMTNIPGTDYWYYDTPLEYVIFNDGTNGTVVGTNKTVDLKIPDTENSVFPSLSSKTWNSTPYFLKECSVDITSRVSGANELYAMRDDSCVFSKYKYPARDNFTSKTVYIYNPDWTAAYVTYDMDDPYRTTVTASAVTSMGKGFFSVSVPENSAFIFKPNSGNDYGASQKTYVPTGFTTPCFRMKNGANVWCELEDAEGGYADYYAANDLGNGILGVEATYFDYLSDKELSAGWLNPIQAGTGFSGSSDDWYPFDTFNSKISSLASANPAWTFPLYFGNFCNTSDAYATSNHGGPYSTAISDLTRFDYIANNSNGLTDFHYSVRNLAYSSLDSDGDIQAANGLKMPYFDADWLKSQGMAKIVKSYFPFTKTVGSDGVKTYSFNSNNAEDNVYFDWENGQPVSVKYGSGTGYGVKDGISMFMDPTTSGQSSGYGIFPFNNAVADSGRGGNNNLDYGFGIKMDMDFSISEDHPATFKYTGDDDLWVYVTKYNPDGSLGESKLVLDLGGDHKMAEGSIDFKTGTSVAKMSVGITPSAYESNKIYITDSYNWGSGMRVWAWNTGGVGEWYTPYYNSSLGKYYISSSQTGSSGNALSTKTMFKVAKDTSWSGQTAAEDSLGNHYGKNTYTDNLLYTDGGNTYTYNTNYNTHFNFKNDGTNGIETNTLYRMSIFYMERGMIESNSSMSFSTTPAQNILKVNKTVDTDTINPGLENAVKQLEDFTFTPTENGSGVSGKAYTVSDSASPLICNGNFKLKDQQSAAFDNQFKTGSVMRVAESEDTTGIKYYTSWEVVDNSAGKLIDSGATKTTNDFSLVNSKNPEDYANMQVNFYNMPQTGNIKLTKAVRSEDDRTDITGVTDASFTYRVTVDVNGGSDFVAYPLSYDINGVTQKATADGLITFKAGESVELTDMPVGASYRIEELTTAGYAPLRCYINGVNSTSSSFTSDAAVTSVVATGTTTVQYVNIERPINAKVRATKTLDSKNYTGEEFSFTLTGLASMGFWDGDVYSYTEDIATQSKTVNTVTNGSVEFANNGSEDILRYNKVGVYRYKLVENALSQTDGHKNDIETDSTVYLVEVRVTAGSGSDLVVGAPAYFKPDQSKTEYSAVDFHAEYKLSTIPAFANKTTKGNVTVDKSTQTGDNLAGTTFKIYKTTGKDGELGAEYKTAKTDASGIARFSDIQIFTDASYTSGTLEYQWYCLVETKPTSGFNINSTRQYFRIPEQGSYSLTYSYQNGKIVSPNTSGFGMNGFIIAGLCVIGMGVLLCAGYFVLLKRRCPAYAGRHQRQGK